MARLRIRAAYPYRAHWDETQMGDDGLARLRNYLQPHATEAATVRIQAATLQP